ncbi:response regulator [Desulfothermus okinawensis JCM 13304]
MNKRKGKILVIEDERGVSETLSLLLEDYDIECKIAASGEDGLELLKREKFRLALVDIRLPGMNGVQFIEQAKQLDPHMHFLILTGSMDFHITDISHIGKVRKRIFHKPVLDFSELVEEILSLLG